MPTPRRSPADHLVIISLDALRPEYYLDARWPAPTMRQLLHEGAHAQAVRSVFPSSSYPGHTTLVTGALPARHGVYHNRIFEPSGRAGRWYFEASSIRVPTLWDAARAAGLTSAAVGWPLTAGAPIDWNVPDIWLDGGEGASVEAIRKATRPDGLWEELEREATGRLRPETFGNSRIASAVRIGMIGAQAGATRSGELDELGADPEAPFALSAAPGLEFTDSATGPAVQPNTGMTHGYHPDESEMHTGFIGAGPAFCPGAVAPLLPLQDLAPLAAAVLGLDFSAPDGTLLPGLPTE